MLHLTLCGPWAGRPLCGCDKAERTTAGDTFVHATYAPDAVFTDPDTCPACVEEWNDATDDTSAVDPRRGG